jgi:hypothetical protein
VLPLAHFGATFDVYDSGVVRTGHHNAGERRGSPHHYALEVHHASFLVAGKAHHRSGTSHSRHIGVSKKESFIFNGIDKESRAGMRVVYLMSLDIWRAVICSDMGLV